MPVSAIGWNNSARDESGRISHVTRGGALARVRSDGDVETSWGVLAARADIVAFITFWMSELAAMGPTGKRSYALPDGKFTRFGPMHLVSIDGSGDTDMNCHFMSYEAIFAVAQQLGITPPVIAQPVRAVPVSVFPTVVSAQPSA